MIPKIVETLIVQKLSLIIFSNIYGCNLKSKKSSSKKILFNYSKTLISNNRDQIDSNYMEFKKMWLSWL